MINYIIEYSIRHRWMVFIVAAIVMMAGFYASERINVDAIPDLSDVQVIISTKYPGQSPEIVEDQVTYPLTTAMLSVPHARNVRGFSDFEQSYVYIIFEDGTDIYWARSRVLEYLSVMSGRLPQGVTPQLGPDATGVGWVYEYALVDSSGKYDLHELRSMQDWFLKFELSAIQGVSEVASVGGYVKQYQVEVDPQKLDYYDIPISEVMMAVENASSATGGSIIELGETEFMVRSSAYANKLEDLRNTAIHSEKMGAPVLLSSIADIHFGPEMRRGLAELDGKGEVVGGIVVVRWGDNARKVIERVKTRIEELKGSLPDGVNIIPVYDRSELINRSVRNLLDTLIQMIVVVVLITFVFLPHVRSTLVAVFTLPAGALASILIMHLLGISANIMSLGGIAIAIGEMVDASVVMVENAHKHMERSGGKKKHIDIIIDSAKEVGPALFFSLLILTISFLPVLALGEQSGRLFKPLAYTKTFAMLASAIISITVIPALIVTFIKGRIPPEEKNPLSRISIALYRPVIRWALDHKAMITIAALIITLATIYPLMKIGSEFMPPLYEGDLLYMPTTLPGISIAKAEEILQQTDRIIASFPEVERVFGKAGRAETATDPAPLSMLETTIKLKPQKEWRKGMTPESLIDSLDSAIQFPGLTNSWTMPIRTRIDMLATGIKTPVGIKILGDNYDTLDALGQHLEAVIKKVKGARSVIAERLTGGSYVNIDIDRVRAAGYGLAVGEIHEVINAAIGGMGITKTVEGRQRYSISVRYPRELRDNPEALKRVLIDSPNGMRVPLGQIADINISRGPSMIKSEDSRPTVWIYVDIANTDIGSFISDAQNAVKEEVQLPAGYTLIWSGQFEYMQAAAEKLKIIVPLVLILTFLFLYFNFKNFTDSLIVMLSLPFALVGGIWFFYLLGFNSSVAVWVGFIGLAGLAAETGVVMLVYIEEAYARYKAEGRLKTLTDLRDAIIEGAVDRVRPKLMTVSNTIVALMPIMFDRGTGSEVMRRIAAPMIGGLVSSTILTLVIVPAVYYLIKSRQISSTDELISE